jgi:uncharacterized tellurite resistance protein B-like protein
MLRKLSKEERLQLMRFVCSFAWADLEVQAEERQLVARMADRLGLSDPEKKQVARWLTSPPPIDSVDPADVPSAHRKLFVDAVREVIKADGVVTPEEHDLFQVFVQLLQTK